MVNLIEICSPEDFENFVKVIPHFAIVKTTKTGVNLTILDVRSIIMIKREILNYIENWKKDLPKYENALELIEDITEDCYSFNQEEVNYLESMKITLASIESNVRNKKNSIPTNKQKMAISNLKFAIEQCINNNKLNRAISSSLFNQSSAVNDLDNFVINFFGKEYGYVDHSDEFDSKWMNSVIKALPNSDAFEGDFSQDPNF